MASNTRKQLETLLKNINISSGTVLDIGGSQLPIKNRVGKFEPDKYLIADLFEPHEGKPAPDIAFDLNLDNQIIPGSKCDYVFCIEVMEYVYNPLQAIKTINSCLKNGGTAFISFPYIYPAHEPVSEDCLRYTKAGVIKLLESVGMVITEYFGRFTENSDLLALYQAEGMRFSKNLNVNEHNEVGCLVYAKKKE